MGVYELYKPFRNKVAQVACDEALYVIWAYSQYLQIDGFNMPRDIEVNNEFFHLRIPQIWIAEWELELLTKEVIINSGNAAIKSRHLRRWKVLSDIINTLKNLENKIYKFHDSQDKVLMELIRIAHRQFIWQGHPPNSKTAIRYFKIFNRGSINEICSDILKLTVKDIYHCGLALLGVYFSHTAMNYPYTNTIKQLKNENIDRFLSLTCRDIKYMRKVLQSEQQYNEKFTYAYNSLRRYPLIRMNYYGKDSIVCPLPTLLFWRMTGGLYYELVKDSRFSQPFGESFQEYVGEVIERACVSLDCDILKEHTYGTKKEQKHSVDWIVSDGNAALFIECKSKRLSWNAKSSLDDPSPLESDLDQLADAIIQNYKTVSDYCRNLYPHFPYSSDCTIYPTIVTLENWHVIGPAMLDRLQSAVSKKILEAGITDIILDNMPYSIWAIEELEAGLQVINGEGIQIVMDGKLRDQEITTWEWASYLWNRFPSYFPLKNLFSDEYNQIGREITK